MTCRTRFAPSPTGFLHIGGARTALYCYLESRRRKGVFVLRIEDTDRERSTQAAVDAILHAMDWLGLEYNEGPIYQTDRLERYKQVAEQLVAEGKAYYAYESKDELEAMRNEALEKNEKPRYNGAYRDANAPLRDDPNRVIRFRNPQDGTVAWDDSIKGRIEFSNTELDDLVIFRSDGYATYNFAVVVDDLDMGITDVIRGDDHVNNTPRQINIFRALGDFMPRFAHMPMILDPEGAKLSKRHGAANVMQYRDDGYLPHALLNYLVRLGWSHGDDEIFSREQFLQWFDLDHLGRSAAQFDEAKLRWVNAQHLKALPDDQLASLVAPFVQQQGVSMDAVRTLKACALFKDRCSTLVELAGWIALIDKGAVASPEDMATHVTAAVQPALASLAKALSECEWSKPAITAVIKQVLTDVGLKMPQLAMPVRVLLLGWKEKVFPLPSFALASRIHPKIRCWSSSIPASSIVTKSPIAMTTDPLEPTSLVRCSSTLNPKPKDAMGDPISTKGSCNWI